MAKVVWQETGASAITAAVEKRVAALNTENLEVGQGLLLAGSFVADGIDGDATAVRVRYRRTGVSGPQIGPTFTYKRSLLQSELPAVVVPPVQVPAGTAGHAAWALTVECVDATVDSATSYAILVATYGDMPQAE